MTATVTDLFCGAGGSSTGAAAAGMQIVMAANHWQTAIDVHQVNHPDAGHDCADISQADPRRYPRTDVLLASPECTNHSQARGVSRKRQDPSLWDAPDPSAERSRATMWDVGRFAEQLRYDAMVVENVVEATRWVGWHAWLRYLTDMGYEHRVLSHNSMHHGVPQSRDRIYIVFWRKGLKPDLEMELDAWCPRCDAVRVTRQAWKRDRWVGRHRQQYTWACIVCGTACEPSTNPAERIIDWSLPCPRIGDRRTKTGKPKPLKPKSRARILAGMQRHGWAPIITAGAGNTYETTPGNRARPIDEPLPVQTTTAEHALATPPAFLFQTAHEGRAVPIEDPHPTVCASDDRHALVIRRFTPRGSTGQMATRPSDPLPAVGASGGHGLLVSLRRNGQSRPLDEPLPTVVAGGNHHGLVVTNDHQNRARGVDEPLATLTTGNRHGLLVRNNQGGAEMVTRLDEPARTITTKGHQSLLVPYYGNGTAQPLDRPMPTVPTKDRFSVITDEELARYGFDGVVTLELLERMVDDCGFRMLEPHEIEAAMAHPARIIPTGLTKKARVRLAGNAVCPPNMTWVTGRVLQALEAAA